MENALLLVNFSLAFLICLASLATRYFSARKVFHDCSILGFSVGVKTYEVFLCVVAIVMMRVDFFVFFVLRHW